MTATKYFVSADERWRELDAESGRVLGWGRARFFYVRRGRLQAARREAVLRGLRVLAAGRPTTVRDGLPLPQYRRVPKKAELAYEEYSVNWCEHCQKHGCPGPRPTALLKPDTCITATQCVRTADAAIQATPTVTLAVPTATLATPTVTLVAPTATLAAPVTTQATSTPQDAGTCTAHAQPRRRRSETVTIPSDTDSSQFERRDKVKPHKRARKRKPSPSEDDRSPARLSRRHLRRRARSPSPSDEEPRKELLIDEDDVVLLRHFIEHDDDNVFDVDLEQFDADDGYKRKIFFKINPLVVVARCRRIQRMLERRGGAERVSLRDFIATLGLQNVDERSSQASSHYKTRAWASGPRRRPRVLSSSSDTDKENFRRRSRRRRPSGPGRNSGVLSEAGRGGANKYPAPADALDGKAQSVKESNQKEVAGDGPAPAQNRVLVGVSSKSKMSKTSHKKIQPSRESPRANRLNDVEQVVRGVSKTAASGKPEASDGVVKPRPVMEKPPNARTSKGGLREYSRLEDEAIVRWLSGEGRARRVNGNCVWRELQPLHQRATGHFRSWHSLRNRYLRYILPALGALRLPPAAEQRLRADAARGELKSRKAPARRNSVFATGGPRGAWARRPRSPPPPTPAPLSPPRARARTVTPASPASPERAPPRLRPRASSPTPAAVASRSSPARTLRSLATPTYSELTRRFAPATSALASASSRRSSPRLAPAPAGAERRRRLYNPRV